MMTAMSFHPQDHHHGSSPSYSNGSSGGYDANEFDDERIFAQRFAAASSPVPQFCACRSNPSTIHALIPLNHQLQNTANALRQCTHHTPDSHCLLYRRIVELNNLMHSSPAGPVAYGPGALPTPDTDTMSPLSSASPFDQPSSGHPGQDWSAIAAAGFNPYFPITSGENGMYST